jgi:iron complex outermembrane recepter protein
MNAGYDSYLGSLRWEPTDEVTLYARAASGYRPGGGRSIPPGAPANFSPVYGSDSIWSYEAGAKYRAPSGNFTIDADAFWIDWSNIQSLVYVGVFNTDGNAGTARSRGFELQSTWVPLEGLTLSANGAYTDAIFTQTVQSFIAGERLYFVPRLTGSVSVDYSRRLWDDWTGSIGGDYSYVGSELDNTYFALPSYTILNLHAGMARDHYSVNLYAKNATNNLARIGDSGYFPGFSPYVVTLHQPLNVGITFNQHF